MMDTPALALWKRKAGGQGLLMHWATQLEMQSSAAVGTNAYIER
jgi:hypothetical protein